MRFIKYKLHFIYIFWSLVADHDFLYRQQKLVGSGTVTMESFHEINIAESTANINKFKKKLDEAEEAGKDQAVLHELDGQIDRWENLRIERLMIRAQY